MPRASFFDSTSPLPWFFKQTSSLIEPTTLALLPELLTPHRSEVSPFTDPYVLFHYPAESKREKPGPVQTPINKTLFFRPLTETRNHLPTLHIAIDISHMHTIFFDIVIRFFSFPLFVQIRLARCSFPRSPFPQATLCPLGVSLVMRLPYLSESWRSLSQHWLLF